MIYWSLRIQLSFSCQLLEKNFFSPAACPFTKTFCIGMLPHLASGDMRGYDSQLLISSNNASMMITYQTLYLIVYFNTFFLLFFVRCGREEGQINQHSYAG